MHPGFHGDKLALGHTFQLVRGHQPPPHHLQAAGIIVLALAHRTGEDGLFSQIFGEGFCCLAAGSETAENGELAVVPYHLRALSAVVFVQLDEALHNGDNTQPAGSGSGKEHLRALQFWDGPELVTVEDAAPGQLSTIFIRHCHQLPVELLDDEAHEKIGGGVLLRHDDEQGVFFPTESLGVDGAAEAEKLLQLGIQKGVETAHSGGENRQHGLLPGVKRRPRHPSRLVFRWELFHEQLEVVFALDLAGSKQILQELEHRNDMPFFGWAELRDQHHDRRQQSLRGVVKIGVLAVVLFTARLNDGFGADLGVLLHLCPCPEVIGVRMILIRVLGDEVKHVRPIASGGIAQVNHRYLVAVTLPRNGTVVTVDVPLGVTCQKADAGRAGIFQIWIKVVGCFSHPGGADHQAVDVAGVNEGGGLLLPGQTAHH